MMSYYQWVAKGSIIHDALRVGDGIAIAAKDNSQKGLERFQRIVRAAFKRQIKEGYKIITHIASGNLYDGMIMYYE